MALIGAIADDLTGASDLALGFAKAGLRTEQVMDASGVAGSDAQALVVALKSRTIPPGEAVAASLEALEALREAGCRRIFFKYCSTFDSTERGNIGPVTEALQQALGATATVASPAFPENARSVYMGHLFVGDTLLSDTHMRDHPLTPMRDSNLVRVLASQSRGGVGLIARPTVAAGSGAIAAAIGKARDEGLAHLVADAIDAVDLDRLGEALIDAPLVTGGSGLGAGIARALARRENISAPEAAAWRRPEGPAFVLSGSCSAATAGQVERFATTRPAHRIDPLAAVADPESAFRESLDWAAARLGDGPALVYSTAEPRTVRAAQEKYGAERTSAALEGITGRLAVELVGRGCRRLVVAGGETSGAVIGALGVKRLAIGPEIAPGVPWTRGVAASGDELELVLKSGNFGGPDFFDTALAGPAA
ncbi:MAG: 3-oxo-tetronate kinase [Flavobacteriaceae bacterium]